MPAERVKSKRVRVNFSTRQIEAMEVVFRSSQYPDPKILAELSQRLDIPMEKICTWFQNRRSKFRKESKNGHIDWMRAQLFGSSDAGGASPPGDCWGPGHGRVAVQKVSPPRNRDSAHVLSPPVTPGGSSPGCPTEYRIPSNGRQYLPQWTPLTPPGPLHVHTSGDVIPQYPSPPRIVAAPTTTSGASSSRNGTHGVSSPALYACATNPYHQYSTLLSACNPVPTPSGASSYTGNMCGQWQSGDASNPMTMTSYQQQGFHDTSVSPPWCEQYDRPINNCYTASSYQYPAFNPAA